MPTPVNSINEATTGICGFTGTAFTGTPATNHAIIVGGATSSTLTNVGPSSTAGQVLQSGGASADPSYSTATYPSTAGTSGNVLTSDGTNWTSAAATGGGAVTITGSLTNAQIKSLHGTPVQIIAAQGSGKVIQVISACGKMNYGGTNVFTAGAGQQISLYYATTTGLFPVVTNAMIVASATQFSSQTNGIVISGANTLTDNTAVNLWVSNATEITGNAANNNTVTYSVTYQVITI